MSKLMSTQEAADYLGRKPVTLQGWRMKGGGPAYIKSGHRTIQYRKEDLDAWIEQRTFGSTAEEKERERAG
jgi:excisionase family DNA binding protein